MKFKVRSGFVVLIDEVRVNTARGGKIAQPARRYDAGDVIDFTGDEALEHAHKLEPADKDAASFLSGRHVKVVGEQPIAS